MLRPFLPVRVEFLLCVRPPLPHFHYPCFLPFTDIRCCSVHDRCTFLSPHPFFLTVALPSLGGVGGGSPLTQNPFVGIVLPSLGGVGGGSPLTQYPFVGVVLPSLGGVGRGFPWVRGGSLSLFLFRRYLFLFQFFVLRKANFLIIKKLIC